MEAHVANAVGMVPVILSRLSALENRTIVHLQNQISQHDRDILEMRRRLGDDAAFSLKARRAQAEDLTMGLAAQKHSSMFDFKDLDISEASSAHANSAGDIMDPLDLTLPPAGLPPVGDVQRRIRIIEDKLAEMRAGDLSAKTIETEYGYAFESNTLPSLHARVDKLEAEHAQFAEHVYGSCATTTQLNDNVGMLLDTIASQQSELHAGVP